MNKLRDMIILGIIASVIIFSILVIGTHLQEMREIELKNLKSNNCQEAKNYDSRGNYWGSESREYVKNKIDRCLVEEYTELEFLKNMSCHELSMRRSDGTGFLTKENLNYANTETRRCADEKEKEFFEILERIKNNSENPDEAIQALERCALNGHIWTENNTCTLTEISPNCSGLGTQYCKYQTQQ